MPNDQETMPSDVSGEVGWFDRFSTATAGFVSRAWFFAACVALVVIWGPSYWLWGDFDTYQLAINTPTTIVTFLLVALLQNTQSRADAATQHKLNAVADALADLMEHEHPRDARELRKAVGLEQRESSS